MLAYLYVFITLILPLPFFIFLVTIKRVRTFFWLLSLCTFLLVYLFTFQAGAWPYIGFNWRYIVLGIYILFGIFIYSRRKKTTISKSGVKKIIGIFCLFIFIGFFGWANFELYNATKNDTESIELSFPFRNGKYVIQQGGNSAIGNIAHRRNIPESMAMDIIKLNEHGMRGNKIFSKDVLDYAIYGDSIFSPCDCFVEVVSNDTKDNIPPYMETLHRCGNSVRLKTGDIKIIFCHLKENSIQVKKNQKLKTGDFIGLVGNTGYSIEPHLHIQAFKKNIYGNQQVPIKFDGKILKMNDVVEVN